MTINEYCPQCQAYARRIVEMETQMKYLEAVKASLQKEATGLCENCMKWADLWKKYDRVAQAAWRLVNCRHIELASKKVELRAALAILEDKPYKEVHERMKK